MLAIYMKLPTPTPFSSAFRSQFGFQIGDHTLEVKDFFGTAITGDKAQLRDHFVDIGRFANFSRTQEHDDKLLTGMRIKRSGYHLTLIAHHQVKLRGSAAIAKIKFHQPLLQFHLKKSPALFRTGFLYG
jgi:hypothetical protein